MTAAANGSAEDAILIFRIGSLGDTVMALPCFHHIARVFPDAPRIVISDIPASQKATSVEAVLGNSGLIQEVIYFPPRPRRIGDFTALRTKIRDVSACMLIYLADREIFSTWRDFLFFRYCGIRNIIGAPVSPRLRHAEIDPVSGVAESEARRLARCIAPLGPIDLDDPAMWDLGLQPREREVAEWALAPLEGVPFIAVNIGGKVAIKDWGDENWLVLLQLMARGGLSSHGLAFFGSADEFDRSSRLAAAWPGARLNLCGTLAARESAAAMACADVFLGHDSGPMHLASAAGVPCVCMFGEFNNPNTWHPYGARHRIVHDMCGVRKIAPVAVYAKLRDTLADSAVERDCRARHSANAGCAIEPLAR